MRRHTGRYLYLDGVDDRGGDTQAEEPLDGSRAVHVVFLHEGAGVVLSGGDGVLAIVRGVWIWVCFLLSYYARAAYRVSVMTPAWRIAASVVLNCEMSLLHAAVYCFRIGVCVIVVVE